MDLLLLIVGGICVIVILTILFPPDNYSSTRKIRDLPPANYTVEIKSYKQLFKSRANLERFESDLFKAGGYKWRLVIYPNGNNMDGGAGHISLYLKIDKSSGFSDNWRVYVNYKLFLQDKKHNNYLVVQDEEVRPFDQTKDEWGFGKFLTLQTFYESSNGYLINDTCVFGAEVSVIKPTGTGETIFVLNNPCKGIQTWKISKFSKLDGTVQSSDEYIVGDRKWKLMLYPMGTGKWKHKFLAISLALVDGKRAVYAHFKLRLVEQERHDNWEQEYWKWFSAQNNNIYKDSKFITLERLRKNYNGYLVDDTLKIELQFLSISDVNSH